MWDFLRHVYDSKDGGFGLLIALIVICESITRIAVALLRRKGK